MPVAIAVERLRREPPFEAGARNFVVITTKAGANMQFECGAHIFVPHTPDGELRDKTGKRWSVTANGLVSEASERLPRIPAYRAFWFGWVAQYPQTLLHK